MRLGWSKHGDRWWSQLRPPAIAGVGWRLWTGAKVEVSLPQCLNWGGGSQELPLRLAPT